MADVNKVKYGLTNVHYTVVNEKDGVITYGTPKRLPGAVQLTLKPKGEQIEFYADDSLYYSEEMNQGYEGDLELSIVPDFFKIEVLGFQEDANGVLFENANAKKQTIALMYEFDGDKNKTRRVNYNVSVSRPEAGSKTKGNKAEMETETLGVIISPANDTKMVQGKTAQGTKVYDDWYKAVYLPVPKTTTEVK